MPTAECGNSGQPEMNARISVKDLCGWRVEVLELEARSAFPSVLPYLKLEI